MTQEHNDEFSSSDDLSSFAISEPENALPRVGLNDVPEMLRAACARHAIASITSPKHRKTPEEDKPLPALLNGYIP